MIRHVWTVYCRSVLTDKETNNVSLIQALESIHFKGVGDGTDSGKRTAIPFNSSLITLWARKAWDTPVTSTMRIRFIGPDESELLNSTFVVNLQDQERTRSIARLNALGINGSGVYEWVVDRVGEDEEDEWVEEARVPVAVTVEWTSAGGDLAPA